jgi:hypothetical protein
MAEANLVHREWVQELLPEQVRMRCWYKRRGKRIMQYTVQLEALHQGTWHPVVRFDNAHGFCHRDDIHPDGTQEKTAMFVGDANDTFTRAVKEVQATWEIHRNRFIRELQS